VLASSATGQELHRVDAPASVPDTATAVGWLGRDDVVLEVGSHGGGSRMWRTTADHVTRTPGRPFAASRRSGVVAGAAPQSASSDLPCPLVFSADPPSTVFWHRCLVRGTAAFAGELGSFSPDGRLLLVEALDQSYGSEPFVVVLDTRSGDVVAWFDEGRYGGDNVGARYGVSQAAFEDDGHVLLVVTDRTGSWAARPRQAIIRCDLGKGECERATPLRTWNGTFPGRYGLAG
jgi:hypothetical protein